MKTLQMADCWKVKFPSSKDLALVAMAVQEQVMESLMQNEARST